MRTCIPVLNRLTTADTPMSSVIPRTHREERGAVDGIAGIHRVDEGGLPGQHFINFRIYLQKAILRKKPRFAPPSSDSR